MMCHDVQLFIVSNCFTCHDIVRQCHELCYDDMYDLTLEHNIGHYVHASSHSKLIITNMTVLTI